MKSVTNELKYEILFNTHIQNLEYCRYLLKPTRDEIWDTVTIVTIDDIKIANITACKWLSQGRINSK